MASDIWLRTIQIVREKTHCRHMGYSFWLTARVLLYAPSHRQDSTYHGLCYTSRGALAGTRNSSMGPPHEGSIRRPIAPWANALTTELHLAPERDARGYLPIVVRFLHQVDRDMIVSSAYRLKTSKITIHTDLPVILKKTRGIITYNVHIWHFSMVYLM